MIKSIIGMKIQQWMKVILLLSLFLLSPLYAQESEFVEEQKVEEILVLPDDYINEEQRAEEMLLAEQFIIREIKADILYLLETRDPERVERDVYGDCIHFYLSTEDSITIAAEEVIPKLHLLFDDNFITNLDHLRIGDNLHFRPYEEGAYSDEDEYKGSIRIFVLVKYHKDDDENFTKGYLFNNKRGHWIFAGMNCIG